LPGATEENTEKTLVPEAHFPSENQTEYFPNKSMQRAYMQWSMEDPQSPIHEYRKHDVDGLP
jgi:hypothetical protein